MCLWHYLKLNKDTTFKRFFSVWTDDTVHESAEPSRGENAAQTPRISSWLLAALLFLLAMLLTL